MSASPPSGGIDVGRCARCRESRSDSPRVRGLALTRYPSLLLANVAISPGHPESSAPSPTRFARANVSLTWASPRPPRGVKAYAHSKSPWKRRPPRRGAGHKPAARSPMCAQTRWPSVVALQRKPTSFSPVPLRRQNLVPCRLPRPSLRPESQRASYHRQDAGVASTFSAFRLEGLVAVDPLDRREMTTTLREAINGRAGRITDRFIEEVRRRDALAWATGFLEALEDPC